MAGLTQEQKNQFFDLFKSMSIMDASEMKKRIETELGIEASTPMAAMAMMPGMGGAAAAVQAEEPTEFTITLTEIGDKKIQVIKAVREITNLGLKEAKELVDGAPKPVKESVSKEEAEEIKGRLEAAGAKAEIKPT
jgi:large subunit ribosomal protein L7/L12